MEVGEVRLGKRAREGEQRESEEREMFGGTVIRNRENI